MREGADGEPAGREREREGWRERHTQGKIEGAEGELAWAGERERGIQGERGVQRETGGQRER